MVDPNELSTILLNIEKTKYGEYYTTEVSKITLPDMKKRMCIVHYFIEAIINPDFPMTELNNLFLGMTEMSSHELYYHLRNNNVVDIDPVNEAIKLICDERD